jgi:hypothetical protein
VYNAGVHESVQADIIKMLKGKSLAELQVTD